MQKKYPRFDKKIQEQIDATRLKESRTRPGMVISFNPVNNTATVVVDDPHSGKPGQVLNNVPCPVTKGLQTVAPFVGTRCLIGFRNTQETDPYILNFFDDVKSSSYYNRNYSVETGIPRYLID
jgi:hypothetical protein